MINGPSEGLFPLEKEYTRAITALNRTGVLALLPRSENLGVVGIDGKEYPVPTREQLREVFTRNEELVDGKTLQGFTQLQLTPIAMPTSQLIDRVKTAVLRHAAAGKIFQTKQDSADADIPVRANTEPVWIWELVRQALDTPNLVYFPKDYTDHHRGYTKEEVMQAIPSSSMDIVRSRNP